MMKKVVLEYINPIVLVCWLASLVFEEEYKLTTVLSLILCALNIYFIKNIFRTFTLIEFYKKNKPFIFSILIFIITNSFNIFFLDYNKNDLKYIVDFIKYSSFVIIPFFLLQNVKSLKYTFFGCSIVTLLFSLNGIYEYFVLNFSRAGSIPTLYAYVLSLLFPLGAVYFKLFDSQSRIYLIIPVISLIALILTQTRACWIACGVALCVIAYIYKDSIKAKDIKIIGIAFLLLIVLSSPILLKRMQDTVYYKHSYSVERLYIWESAYKMGKDFFLTGIGQDRDRFRELYSSKYQLPESKEKGIIHPHNIFLNFFVKSGIFGLLAYVFFQVMQLIYFSKTVFSKNKILKVLSVIGIWFFIVNLIGGCFEAYFHFIKMQKIYWVMFGIIIAGIELIKNKEFN